MNTSLFQHKHIQCWASQRNNTHIYSSHGYSPSSSSSSSSNDDDDDNMERFTIDNERGLTQPPPPPPPDPESSPIVNEQGLTPSSESVLVPGLDEREYVEEWEQGGVVYRVGDVVHLMPIR